MDNNNNGYPPNMPQQYVGQQGSQPAIPQPNMQQVNMPQQVNIPQQAGAQQVNIPQQAGAQQVNIPQQAGAQQQAMPHPNMPRSFYHQQYVPQPYIPVKRPDTEQTRILKWNFGVLGLASFLYACFYAFCMYKNGSGITYPFFLAGSLWFYCFCMKKLGISLKKDSIFYMVSILLLGLSTFCTADFKIIAMNKTGIWVLTISFLLHQFYMDKNWTFGRYAGYVIATVFGSVGEIARPFLDFAGYRKTRGKKGKGVMFYIVIGLCFSIPLLAFVWLMLMSADKVFNIMTIQVLKKLDIGNIIGISAMTIFMFFMAYCIMSYLCKKEFSEKSWKKIQMESLIAITVTLPITILYAVFSVVQIVCLFFGKIDLTKFSYAEYAREGFFQLLLICVLNLALVLAGHAYFKENIWLKLILAVMSGCTYIMIASSAYRMVLYIKHYYFTFLRIFVLWSLLVLFILLTGVMINIFVKEFPLFKYSMIVVTLCYLLLSFARPDYWIARFNVENMGDNKNEFFDADAYQDFGYLSRLSADAAPAFAEYFAAEGFFMEDAAKGVMKRQRWEAGEADFTSYYDLYGGFRDEEDSWGYYYLERIYESYDRMGIRSFNLSKYIAYQILK